MVHLSTYTLNTGCSQNCSSLMKETDRRKDHNTESNSASSSELTTALSPMTSGYSLRTPFIEKLGLGEVPLPELVSGTGVCPQGRLLGKKKCQHSSLEAYTYGSTMGYESSPEDWESSSAASVRARGVIALQ
ncbi:uncharacterized protein AAES06_021101 isoform 2-T7 [Glossophaga mutica]